MDEDFETDDDLNMEEEDSMDTVLPVPSRQLEIRRAIEDHLAEKQLKEELGLY